VPSNNININYTDLKRKLQSLKRELKGWEAMFERKHGHKPTKVCHEASIDIHVYVAMLIE
jgi:hypothetical protein